MSLRSIIKRILPKTMGEPRWRDVKKELPPCGQEVIVLTDEMNGRIIPGLDRICYGHIVNPGLCVSYDGWNIPGVKCWMPVAMPYEKRRMIRKNKEVLGADFDAEFNRFLESVKERVENPRERDVSIREVALHFVLWQKGQDKTRLNACRALANAPAYCSEEAEMAFAEMWNEIGESFKGIVPKPVARDWFVYGVKWRRKKK